MKCSLTLTIEDLTEVNFTHGVSTPCQRPHPTRIKARGQRLSRCRIRGCLITRGSCPDAWILGIKHRERKSGGGAAVTRESIALRKEEGITQREG